MLICLPGRRKVSTNKPANRPNQGENCPGQHIQLSSQGPVLYNPHRDNRAGILSRQIKATKRGKMPLQHVQLSSQGPVLYNPHRDSRAEILSRQIKVIERGICPYNMFNYLHKALLYTPHRDNRAGIFSRQMLSHQLLTGNMPRTTSSIICTRPSALLYTPHRDSRAGILSRQIKDIKRGNMPLKHVVQLSTQGPAILYSVYPSQGQPSWDP
jgi:hypothetical protein